MNKRMLFEKMGAAALIASFGLAACGDDSFSAPVSSSDAVESSVSCCWKMFVSMRAKKKTIRISQKSWRTDLTCL